MESLSIRELKAECSRLNIPLNGILEKSEIIKALKDKRLEKTKQSDSTKNQEKTIDTSDHIRYTEPYPINSNPLKNCILHFPNSILKKILQFNAIKTRSFFDKNDLINAIINGPLLNINCPICLSPILESSRMAIPIFCCRESYFHEECLWEYFKTQVSNLGRSRILCPSCRQGEFSEKYYFENFEKFNDFHKYHQYLLRNIEIEKKNTIETNLDLEELGYRQCPKCHSYIEKNEEKVSVFGQDLDGCDKMTCRCGAKFCYKCGSINANCHCTSDHHSFFNVNEVLGNYDQIRAAEGANNMMNGFMNNIAGSIFSNLRRN